MVWLLSRGKLRPLRTGDRLVEAGRPVGDLYFVLAGTLEVVRGDGACVATIGEGEVVGEMSFVDDRAPSVSVRASGRCEVLGTPRAAILERFEREPLFAARFYRALAKFLSDRLRETTAALLAPAEEARPPDTPATASARIRSLFGGLRGNAG